MMKGMITLQVSMEGHGMLSPGRQGRPPLTLHLVPPCCPVGDPPCSKGWCSSLSRLCWLEAVSDHFPTKTNRSQLLAGLPRQYSNVLRRTGRRCVQKSRQTERPPRQGSFSPTGTLIQTQWRQDPCNAFCRMLAPLPREGWGSRGLCQDQADRRRGNRAGCSSSAMVSNDRAQG